MGSNLLFIMYVLYKQKKKTTTLNTQNFG